MFCQNCGKEISDQAKFCNHCGASTAKSRPQAAPAQPKAAPAAQPKQPAPGKKGGLGRFLFTAAIAFVVFFVVRSITSGLVADELRRTNTETGFEEGIKEKPTDTCILGALYENGALTYGSARLTMPGYTLLPDDGSGTDFLMSADQNSFLSVTKQIEINMSYDMSDAEGLLASYANDGVANAAMEQFQKYEVGGYPIIRHIASGTLDGVDLYMAELVVFPDKQPLETMRFIMQGYGQAGFDEINRVFDTLDISPDHAQSSIDPENMGLGRIHVR